MSCVNSLEIVEAVRFVILFALLHDVPSGGVSGLLLVADHGVPGHVGVGPGEVQLLLPDPERHVVVFAAPTPKLIGEAVETLEGVAVHGAHAAEELRIGQFVVEGVDGGAHVSRGLPTPVPDIVHILNNYLDAK